MQWALGVLPSRYQLSRAMRFSTREINKVSLAHITIRLSTLAITLLMIVTTSFAATQIEMVKVKGGCFQMGDIFADGGKEEKPVHEVCVGDFHIGKYEVTQAQWKGVMGKNPAKFTGDRRPVESVSWYAVQTFIGKLNAMTGKQYRLPTEAEWEYAAKSGGKEEKWAGTSDPVKLNEYAWYEDNSLKKSYAVGTRKPNNLGIYDMSGNVFEWCQDIFSDDWYDVSDKDNPLGPPKGPNRVIRGGSWYNSAGYIRTSYRFGNSPDSRGQYVGFRLVLPVSDAKSPAASDSQPLKQTLRKPDAVKTGSAKAKLPSSKSINDLPPQDRLKSCEPGIALAAAAEIVNNPENLKEPLELFPAATVFYKNGKKDEAVFWYYAAQLRVQYQLAFEAGDRRQLLAVMQMAVGPPIINYAFQYVSNLNRILDRVLEWDAKTVNPHREKTRSESSEKQIVQLYAGLNDFRTKLTAERTEIERKALSEAAQIEAAYTQANPLCRKGQIDPAYAGQETKREWALATDFVKNHNDVIKETGKIKEIYPNSSTLKSIDVMPSRYILSVNRHFYAVVDVARSAGDVKFTLGCVSKVSPANLDAYKDVCDQ